MNPKNYKTRNTEVFAIRLTAWLRANYGSQRAFAKRYGIPVTTLSGYCTGRCFPNYEFINLLVSLKCDIRKLFEAYRERRLGDFGDWQKIYQIASGNIHINGELR